MIHYTAAVGLLLSATQTNAFVSHSPFARTGPSSWTAGVARQAATSGTARTARSCFGLSAVMNADPVGEDNKLLHVVYRVGDLERTTKFYEDMFGMKVLRSRDVPDEKYTNVFLGYGTESRGEHVSVELTYNYGRDKYEIGDGFRGLGISLPDIQPIYQKALMAGADVLTELKTVNFVASQYPDEDWRDTSTNTTFFKIADPEGYVFEVQQEKRKDPMTKICFRVDDIDKSIDFYRNALGMRLFRKRSNTPSEAALVAWMGYGREYPGNEFDYAHIQLKYEYGKEDGVDHGDAYAQIAVSVPDVYKAADRIKAAGYEVTREPGPIPGLGTKITAVRDPDGYKIVLVDAEDLEAELVEEPAKGGD